MVSLARMRLPGMAAMIAAPAALLLSPGRAEAILTYNIFQSGSDVVVQTSGSLDLPATTSTGNCGTIGLLDSSSRILMHRQ